MMSDYTFITKYAHKKDDGTKETWIESVSRIWDTHRIKYKEQLVESEKLRSLFEMSEQLEKDKVSLSAQRLRQFAIPDLTKGIFKHNFKAYNCSATYMDRPDVFKELMYVLLCGAGAGISVQNKHISRLPKVNYRNKDVKFHVVDDSIEGWAIAVDTLVKSYFIEDSATIEFDYSKVRPAGSLIAGQFSAPGPDGLKNSLSKIEHIFDKAKGRQLKSIEVYDIAMWIADAVLSGGVRRSAVLVQFSSDDISMMNAKIGNWFETEPQRRLSNNSAVIIRNKGSRDLFDTLIESTKNYGEPGFLFLEDEDVVLNPCAEISMLPKTEDGRSGWSVCNLTEINGGAIKSETDFLKAVIAASTTGTLQAGYTNFSFLGDATEEIIRRDALIGVSITGWMNSPSVLFNEELLKKGAGLVIETNHTVADIIGINYAKRTTTVKPAGTSSILLGTTSGIHGEHSPRYIRNIQANKKELGQQVYNEINPFSVENSYTSDTDVVLSFAIKADDDSIFKKDITGVKHLEYAKLVQQNWIEYGTYDKETFGIKMRHNVSITVQVEDDKWSEVADYLWKNQNVFSGVSFLPFSGDLDYPQAPFQSVKTPEELTKKYGSGAILASGLIVEAPGVFNNLWEACNAAKYNKNLKPKVNDDLQTKLKMNRQYDWVRRLKKFAKNYCDNNLDKAIYCVKDVHLLHKYNKLKNETLQIDWSHIDFTKDAIQQIASLEAACAGGKCES